MQQQVGVLLEHFINRNNNNGSDPNSFIQHQRNEYNKYFSQKKVDLEMQFKVRKKLPASTDSKDGPAQVEILEWFQETIDFVSKNDKIQYEFTVLIRIIVEKGMSGDMLKKFNQVRRDFDEFQSWDHFAHWIFQVHKLSGPCMITLRE